MKTKRIFNIETENIYAKLILVILVIAAFIRLWQLGTVPPHLTQDEAALGYNAFSILKTGKDEYGEFFPIIFKSFGDYKPGFYVYLTVPFVAVLGLTEFAVRLPSTLAGVLAVFLIYKIMINAQSVIVKKINNIAINNQSLAIISSFLLAINPWHIHFSRGAWEANVSLTLTLAGIYLFLKAINTANNTLQEGMRNSQSIKNNKNGLVLKLTNNEKLKQRVYLLLSSLFFSLTFITYQGAKLSTIIVLFVFTLAFWKKLTPLIKYNLGTVLMSLLIGLMIMSPAILSLFQGHAGRLEVYSVFSYPRGTEYLQTFLDQGSEIKNTISYYLFHSESLNFFRGIMGRWFNHFSGKFLFFEGDWQNPRHSAPYHGMFLLSDLILFILGIIALMKRSDKMSFLILFWLILAPLPAVLSRDQVQAVRSLNMVIPMVLIVALGMNQLFVIGDMFNKSFLKKLFLGTFSILYISAFIYFMDAYFIHLPVHNAQYWNYGYKQTFQELSKLSSQDDEILFQQSYAQPYIYYLFYESYDPAIYQKKATLTESGLDVGIVDELDNFTFRFLSWPVNEGEFDYIVADGIVIPEIVGEGFKIIHEVKFPDSNQAAFRILEDL